jgi:hypothetical protein
MQPRPSLPSGNVSREEVARVELGQTTIARSTVWLLVLFFLALIAVVPMIEWSGVRALRARGIETAWSHLTSLPQRLRSHVVSIAASAGLWERIVSTNRVVLGALSGFENGLEDESVLGRSLRPPAQLAMTRWFGAGNERVYPGHDGWLFYRPDVEYVTTEPFLDPESMRRRITDASEWDTPPQADPRAAIVQFRKDLQARGITLIVMPTPPKPGVHPEHLSRAYVDNPYVLQNPSYGSFSKDLRRHGTLVFDPSEAMLVARRFGAQYLETDTHWRPEAMEQVADLLARFVAANVKLPPLADPGYRVDRREVRNTGDTARMLDLPEWASLFPAESVWLRRVLHEDGSAWRSSRTADVLLLGDSFANIYALESMGWGTSAGLAEQLSYALGRPLDRLVQNDDGAFATREMVARSPSRLDGKRVVIYQFAARELAFGDWKILPLPPPRASEPDRPLQPHID